MRGWTIAWVLAGLLLSNVACNGGGGGKDPLGKDQVILDGKDGKGVVKRFSGVSKPDEALAEGTGTVIFDVQHIDRLVNKEVTLEVFPAGKTTEPLGQVKGNESFVVEMPGETTELKLDVHMVYAHSEITRHEGIMKGVVAHVGRNAKYKVKLEAPVGFLDIKFLNDGVDVGGKVTCDLFAAVEGGGERGEPMVTGFDFEEMLAVPAGEYDVRAQYQETETIRQDAWVEGLEVAGGMARLAREYDFAVTLHGFILHVKNFGEDVSAKSTVYFYAPGANTEFAVAQDQGPAGERLVIKPGTYDVRAVYQPGPEKTTWGDKVLHEVEIGFEAEEEVAEGEEGGEDAAAEGEEGDAAPAEGRSDAPQAAPAEGEGAPAEGEGAPAEGDADAEASPVKEPAPTLIEMEVDVEKPLGTIVIKALYGGVDVSEKAILRALFAGADKSAASAVLAVTGLSTHVIPAGDYDIGITYEESDLQGAVWFDGVHFEHGTVWEQEVDLAAK
jgi:hypothetical protein